tara:strand:- start:21 stop:998 length:978 start_codon:yes stop_codon:yes gene_type:complete
MYQQISKIYPRRVKEKYKKLLMYCDIKTDERTYLSGIALGSLLLSLLIGLLVKISFDFSFFVVFFILLFVVHFTTYAWLLLNADARARFVEDLLPDMLQLMSSNLRAGYTIDRALLFSARPEFGRFKKEIERVGKEVATGKEFNEALEGLGKRVKSTKLQKTIKLIIAGQQSGGQLSSLLEQSATNLRQQKIVDERVRSNVLVYVIFIFVAIGFGTPVLFGLSSFLIEVITDLFSTIQIPETTGVGMNIPLTFTNVAIEPSFVRKYTLISMTITSIMGSLVLGLISKGKEKEGFKYIPILLAITIPLYFLVKFLISSLLSGLFNL